MRIFLILVGLSLVITAIVIEGFDSTPTWAISGVGFSILAIIASKQRLATPYRRELLQLQFNSEEAEQEFVFWLRERGALDFWSYCGEEDPNFSILGYSDGEDEIAV